MDKGSVFERSGKHYKCLQDGIKYVIKNKTNCIRLQGDSNSKSISKSIPNAIREKLICETSPPDKEGLFSPIQKQIPEHIEQQGIVTELPRVNFPVIA